MDMSIMKLFTKTMPFFIARLVVYGIFALAAMIFLGIMVGIGALVIKMFGESGVFFVIVLISAFGVVYGGLRFVERYVLYIVKIGHVSVVTELLRTGTIPEGKGQVAYGKDQVTKNFGTANVAFLLDSMVAAAVRQIQRWINRIGNLFSFIPGSKNIIGIINSIMTVALNYIDEAIVSYIFVRKSEKRAESVWKSAADGVVLYAQSWKGILKTAVGSVIFIWIFNILVFLTLALSFMFVSKLATSGNPDASYVVGAIAIVAAYVGTTLLKRALLDPIITIAMIRAYQMSIRNMEPEVDLHHKLVGVSSKFKKLVDKGKEEEETAYVSKDTILTQE